MTPPLLHSKIRNMKTIIIIPTYNERENIAELVERIFKLNIPDLEIIFVDDNSPDGTGDLISQFSQKHPIILIPRPSKLGLGSAYIAGFKKALADGADFVFEMDADLSHAPEDIPALLEAVKNGADLAVGSRRVADGKIIGWNMRRHFTSAAAAAFARFFLRLKTRDVTAGFRCYRRDILEKINLEKIKSNGYAFQEEMLFRVEHLNGKIKEIPVIFNDRQQGKSKLSFKDITEFFLTMARLFFDK